VEHLPKIKERILFIELEDMNSHSFVSPFDVGSGMSQLLPIIVQGLVKNSQIILVEQPELHLHPKLQGDLADFFIETSIKEKTSAFTSHPNQWIIETHSEALIIRLLRRIRENKISNNDISVIYVDPHPKGSRIIQLRINKYGDFIDDWPHGFFEETYHDIFGY